IRQTCIFRINKNVVHKGYTSVDFMKFLANFHFAFLLFISIFWYLTLRVPMPFYFTSLTTPSPKISSSPYGMWVLPHSALASRLALF
ncbi:MAG: hypothetical protein MR936_08495, partial [Eubacterium sp.]|nr:hypothetical protein [Eubacterium sp.]